MFAEQDIFEIYFDIPCAIAGAFAIPKGILLYWKYQKGVDIIVKSLLSSFNSTHRRKPI